MKNHYGTVCFVYPSDPLNSKCIDEQFKDEEACIRQYGFITAVISLENMQGGLKYNTSVSQDKLTAIYRGWMLNEESYKNLVNLFEKNNLLPLTTVQQYLLTHHLPNWYPLLTDLTPETKIFPLDENLPFLINQLGWNKYFIKDYVKSLKTSIGSIITSAGKINNLIGEMKKYRGTIEGGICVRKYEDFIPESERRYFVINKIPYSIDAYEQIPKIIFDCAYKVNSPFFSVDLIQRSDRQLRIVELGDGQVSDLVGWSVQRFSEIWLLALKDK